MKIKQILAIAFLLMFSTSVYSVPPAPTPAKQSKTDVTNFGGNLGGTDTTVQIALDTLDDIALGGDTTETNQDDAWAVLTGTETGIDVTYQDATNDVDFIIDVTPSAGSATLIIEQDAVQVKYDSTDFQEGANGLYLGAAPTITGDLSLGAAPASTGAAVGDLLMSNATGIYFEADAAGTDIAAIVVDSAELITIGGSGASGVTITPATTITGVLTTGSTIEIGHANDTTLARDSAGVISVQGSVVSLLGATIGAAEVDADVATQAEIDLKANIASPTLTGIVTFPIAATPTTDADGEMSFDTDGWGTGYDALEIWNGTASAYVVATTASDTPTNGQVPKWNTGGTITWEADADTGGAPALSAVTSPTGASTLTFGDTEILTWTSQETDADPFIFEATGAFGDISIFKIEQKTGNPTDGDLLHLLTADANVDHLLLDYAGTDYVTMKVIDAGTFTIDVTSDGTAAVTIADPLTLSSTLTDGTATLSSGAWSGISTLAMTGALSGFTTAVAGTSIEAPFFVTGSAATAADAGAIRLANTNDIAWEADAAGTDVVGMSVDASEIVQIAPSGSSGVTITPATTITGALTLSSTFTDGTLTGDGAGGITGIATLNAVSAAELAYIDIASLGTGVASKAVVLSGTGGYTAPAGTWDLSGVTAITLRAGEVVLADLDAGVFAKDIVTTAPITGAADNVLVGADSDVTLALDFTATFDFGGATALEIPNGLDPAAATTGSIALDTNGDDGEFDGPVLVVSTSGATMGYIVTTAGLPGTAEDNYVIKYAAGTDTVQWEADSTGSALGTNLASTTNDITTDNAIIQLEESGGNSENLTITFAANDVAITSDSGVLAVDFGTINLETDALDLSAGTITSVGQIDSGAGTALAIGDGADDVVAIDSTVWDITGAGAASFVDLVIAKAEPIIQLDGTDNWEIRSDDTGNSLEISSAIGGGVGDNVELEIDTSGNVTATGNVIVGGDLIAGAGDALDIGDASETITITSSDWTIDATGVVAGLGTIGSGAITSTGAVQGTSLVASAGGATLTHSTPQMIFDDTGGADGRIDVDATDADDSKMTFRVDDGTTGDDTAYLEIDGVAETVDVLVPLTGTDATFTGTTTVSTLTQAATAAPTWTASDSSANADGTFDIKVDAITAKYAGVLNFYVDEGDGAGGDGAEDVKFMTINGNGVNSTASGTIEFERIGNFEMGLSTSNAATTAGFVDFYEDSDDGSSYVRLISPALAATITLTLPNTDGDNTNILATDGAGAMYWTSAGAATAWQNIVDPSANKALDFTDYYTSMDFGDVDNDMFTVYGTGAFGNYSIMRIEQITGAATDGEVLSLAVADNEANVDQLAIFNGTDHSMLLRLLGTGEFTNTLTSTDGFAQWLYTTPEDGAGATDTDGIFEIITNATMDADQDIFNVVKGTDTLFSVDEDGDVEFDGALTFGSTINGHTFTAGSSTFTGTAAATYTFPAATADIAPLASPSFTTPAIGAATGTSLGLGDAGWVGIASNEIITFNAAGTIVASVGIFSSTAGTAVNAPVIDDAADLTTPLPAPTTYGGTFIVNADAGDGLVELPALAAGMNFVLEVDTGLGPISVDRDGSDTMTLSYLIDGTATQTAAITSIDITGPEVCVFQYRSAGVWDVQCGDGTVDGS